MGYLKGLEHKLGKIIEHLKKFKEHGENIVKMGFSHYYLCSIREGGHRGRIQDDFNYYYAFC